MDRNSEINTRGSKKMESLSARRAWIEISPIAAPSEAPTVALRKESVDRNDVLAVSALLELMSLSARRAWIEMLLLFWSIWR